MQKVIFIFLFSFTTVCALFGQFTVNGKISDSADKTPIEFATVTVFNQADSSLTGGTVTDSTGFSVLKIWKRERII
ncbi:MAG: hypothetical protein IPM77_02505 [Crocinitomicaceae bacterium]|nr:hypothetical protein [Crocinitomicaceae bacterium]